MSNIRIIPVADPDTQDGIAINYGDYEQQYDYVGEAYDDAARRIRLQRSYMASLRLKVLDLERRIRNEQLDLDTIEQIHNDLSTYL